MALGVVSSNEEGWFANEVASLVVVVVAAVSLGDVWRSLRVLPDWRELGER